MLHRSLFTLVVAVVASSWAMGQDTVVNPPRGTDFATVGRPPMPTALGGRVLERLEDRLDRHPCCGYGKVNTDMGVPGFRSTNSFYWGSGCEFFREGCQRSTVDVERRPNGVQRFFGEMFGSGDGGCKSCGR